MPGTERPLTEKEIQLVAAILRELPELRDEFLENKAAYQACILDEDGSIRISGGPAVPLRQSLEGPVVTGYLQDDPRPPNGARIELILFYEAGRPCELEIFRQDHGTITGELDPSKVQPY
jgi:hypothetical protein